MVARRSGTTHEWEQRQLADTVESVLLGVLLLAATVWIGGFVALLVVARVSSRTLDPSSRVDFFRVLGRSYGIVAGIALLLGLVSGALLLFDQRWSGSSTAIVVVATAIVVATLLGVVQARGMTRQRGRALANPEDSELARRVRRGARSAGILRALIGVLSLALLALGVVHGG